MQGFVRGRVLCQQAQTNNFHSKVGVHVHVRRHVRGNIRLFSRLKTAIFVDGWSPLILSNELLGICSLHHFTCCSAGCGQIVMEQLQSSKSSKNVMNKQGIEKYIFFSN